jgi:phosphatidylethanolamine-binding protein (PEBP) family uncharacterized protein
MKFLLFASFLSLSLTTAANAEMALSFEWGKTGKCFDSKSPPMSISGVPAGTQTLDIKMKDQNSPYNHGGGKVKYTGQTKLPYGAFKYQGPCPPIPHTYQFTARALDGNGKVLATAKARRKFPE